MNGVKSGKYVPSSVISSEPLTDKYTVGDNIGRGKFAVVRKCVNNETKEVVAAKFIRKRRKGKSAREEILREVVMLEMAMSHPRLVDLLEVYETQSELILITEYCEGGELFHECVIEESFQEQDVVRLVIQILEGLVFLHEQKIVHLDLKPQNILLTKPFPHGNIKICDLGFACLVHKGEDIRDIIGTADYVAPEVLDYEPLDMQTDMWSMGVLTYVMLTAFSPFAGDNQQETFCNISTVKLDFPDELFEDKSQHCQDFISKLLVKNGRKRLTARQCFEHPWLKSHIVQASLPPTVSNENIPEVSVSKNNENNPKTLPAIPDKLPSTDNGKNGALHQRIVIDEQKFSDDVSHSDHNGMHVDENAQRVPSKPAQTVDNKVNSDTLTCDTQSIQCESEAKSPLTSNNVQTDENKKNADKSVSKATYSVNKVIVLKPTISPKPKLKEKPSFLKNLATTSDQSEIKQFLENFQRKTELSSPTNEHKQFSAASVTAVEKGKGNSAENIIHNPFNGSAIKIVCNSKTQRNSLPGRVGLESIKNKDKDESFKRRSMEIPIKRLKSENGDLEKLPSFVQNEFNCVEEVTLVNDTISSSKAQ